MKKLISLVLCLVLLRSLALPACAQSQTIQIRTFDDLMALSEHCASDQYSDGLTVELMNDLTLDRSFTPIPLFQGVFEGNGHTISGFLIDADASTCGFFRQVLEGGTVRDLHIVGEVIPSGSGEAVGGIVGKNSGTLSACSFSGTVSGIRSVGGIAGSNTSTGRIENSVVAGEIGGQHKVGGIAGENAGVIFGCISSAAVGTKDPGSVFPEEADLTLSAEELVDITDIGGIAGFSSGCISDSINRGPVGYFRIGYNIGGITGRQSGIVTGCRNEAAVNGRKDVGGISGQLDPDAEWHMDQNALNDLKERVAVLNDKMNVLIDDTETLQNGLGTDVSDIHASIEKASTSAHDLVSSAESWADENIAAVNSILLLIEDTIDAVVPVSRALGDFVNALPPILTELSTAAEHAAAASNGSSRALLAFDAALGDLDNALNEVRAAEGKVSQGFTILDGITSPADIPTAAAAAAAQLRQGLQDAENALDDCGTALDSLQTATYLFSSSAKDVEGLMTSLKNAFRKMNDAEDNLSNAIDLTEKLLKMLSDREMPAFTGVERDSASQQDFFDAIGEINNELGHLSGLITDTRLTEDVRAAVHELGGLVATVLDLFTAPKVSGDLAEDISAASENGRTKGTVSACTNTGDISADTNVGGVIGSISIDVSFDREDELNISEFLSGGAKYLIYASVSDCQSYADIAAANAAGGIVGRMDYGVVRFCSSVGKIAAKEQCSGGIAGYCRGTVSNCMSRAVLTAAGYCGGIAGLGANITSCLAMPSFGDPCEYMGSIAGKAEGTVLDNCYAQSRIGGIDGFSFSNQSESVSHERLLELAGADSVFETVTITFLVGDVVYAQIDIPFGGRVEQLPKVAPDGRRVWQWDDFDNTAIFESREVIGHYVGAISTISTGEEVPQFLAEGSFSQNQTLSAEFFDYAGSSMAVRLTISDVSPDDQFTFRMRAPSGGDLYRLDGDDILTELTYTVDGNYLCFDGPSGMQLIYMDAQQPHLLWVVGVAVAAGAAVGTAVLLWRRKKLRNRAKADKKVTQSGS